MSDASTQNCPRCGQPLRVRELTLKVLPGQAPYRLRAVGRCTHCEATDKAQAEARLRAELRRRGFRECGVPKELHFRSLHAETDPTLEEDPLNEQALEALRLWLQAGCNIYLYGGPGSGKSHLAMAATLDCLRLEPPVRSIYLREQDFLKLVRARWKDPEADQALDRLGVTPALIFDDLASHQLNQPFREALYDLLNERCSGRSFSRRTLLLSSQSTQDVRRWASEPGGRGALWSRLEETVSGQSVALLGMRRRFSGGSH